MIILYARSGQSLEGIKKDIMSYKFLNYDNKYVEMPRSKYLCKKLADYTLPPSKFKVVSENSKELDDVLTKQIKYKKLTYKVLRDSLLYGAGAELIQLGTDKKTVIAKRIDPEKLIVIQESEFEPPHTILFWEPIPTDEAQTKEQLNWFGDKKVWIDDGKQQVIIEGDRLIDTIDHGLGIHAINVLMPFAGEVFYEDQKTLIAQYEKTYNFLYKETKSTMNLLISNKEITKDQYEDWGNLRVISGINTALDGKPELLVKAPEYVGSFDFLEVAGKRILQEAGIIDFTSQESAGSDPSGEALKLRLIPMEDKCSEIYPELREFINNRHIIIAKLLGFNYEPDNATITLETNLPEMFLPKVQAYLQLVNTGMISKKTAQEALGFDPEEEEENMRLEDNFEEDIAQESFPTGEASAP